MKTKEADDVLHYSEKIPGETCNHEWPVEFCYGGGCLRISQQQDDGTDAVLLSPSQLAAMQNFLRASGAER